MVEYREGNVKTRTIDVCGTACPYPQLKTKLELDRMKIGESLYIIFDNKVSLENVASCVNHMHDKIIDNVEKDGKYILLVERTDRTYKSSLELTFVK